MQLINTHTFLCLTKIIITHSIYSLSLLGNSYDNNGSNWNNIILLSEQ